MKKKAYQDPTTKVVKIRTARIICTSLTNAYGGEGVDLDYGGAGEDRGANSRGIWGRWDE